MRKGSDTESLSFSIAGSIYVDYENSSKPSMLTLCSHISPGDQHDASLHMWLASYLRRRDRSGSQGRCHTTQGPTSSSDRTWGHEWKSHHSIAKICNPFKAGGKSRTMCEVITSQHRRCEDKRHLVYNSPGITAGGQGARLFPRCVCETAHCRFLQVLEWVPRLVLITSTSSRYKSMSV